VGVLAEVIEFDSLYDKEQLSLNLKVAGSNPAPETNNNKALAIIG